MSKDIATDSQIEIMEVATDSQIRKMNKVFIKSVNLWLSYSILICESVAI